MFPFYADMQWQALPCVPKVKFKLEIKEDISSQKQAKMVNAEYQKPKVQKLWEVSNDFKERMVFEDARFFSGNQASQYR